MTGLVISGGKPYRPVVLVVDDECTIADSLTEILTRSGHNAITAYDAASALDIALMKPPDVLITDVVLPGMNGIDLAITVRRIYPDCKVILFSGNAATSAMLEPATRAGHNFLLLNKPVHPKDMLLRVSECVRARMESMTNQTESVGH
ncbi:MAG: response regulator [Terracidiphilus sp.]